MDIIRSQFEKVLGIGLLLCATAAEAGSNSIDTSVRYSIFAYQYGSRVAAEVDLASSGSSELLVDTGYWGSDAFDSGYVDILDPRGGYDSIHLLSFAPNSLGPVAAVPRSSGGLPNTFVTVSWNPITQSSSTIDVWTGLPPQRIDSFTVPVIPTSLVSGIENVDADAAYELVMSTASGLTIVNLGSHQIQATVPGLSCGDLNFIEYGSGAGKKIVCVPDMNTPAQIIDGSNGTVLTTSPSALGPHIAAGAIHSRVPNELLVFTAGGYIADVGFSPPWVQSNLLYTYTTPYEFDHLRLIDANNDGIAEDFLLANSLGVNLYSSTSGTFVSGYTSNWDCTGNLAVGTFDGTAGLKVLCTSGPLSSGSAYVQKLSSATPSWLAQTTYFSPAAPVVGPIVNASAENVVVVLPAFTTTGTSAVVVLDGASLQEVSHTDYNLNGTNVERLSSVTLARNKKTSLDDVIVGAYDKVAKVVPGNSSPAWVQPVSQPVGALASVDIDGDGQDEVVVVSFTEQTVSVPPFVDGQLVCNVQVLNSGDGSRRWAAATPVTGTLDGPYEVVARTMQLNGVGADDVLVNCGGTVRALRGEDGGTLWEISSNASDVRAITRNGSAQLLFADSSHLERRDPATGHLIAALSGGATSVLDLGSDDNIVVRNNDGTLSRLDATSGRIYGQSQAIGEYYGTSALALGSPAIINGQLHFFANTIYGTVRVTMREDVSLFADGFEASETP